MARKIMVHNLAKEVGCSPKEIIDYLTEKGYASVTQVSAVPESEITAIRAKFGPEIPEDTAAAGKTEETKERAPSEKTESVEADPDKPRKKGMVRVYRSQNATRALQKRPRRTAPRPESNTPHPMEKERGPEARPDSADVKKVSPAGTEERKTEAAPSLIGKPVIQEAASSSDGSVKEERKEVPSVSDADRAVSETTVESASSAGKKSDGGSAEGQVAAGQKEETASAPEEKLPDKDSPVTPALTKGKETAPSSANEEGKNADVQAKSVLPEETAEERKNPKEELSKAEEKKEEQKGSAKPGSLGEGKADQAEAAKGTAAAETAKPAEEKKEDTGFRNGRIIRSFGNLARRETTGRTAGKDGRNTGRTGQTSRERTPLRNGERRGPSSSNTARGSAPGSRTSSDRNQGGRTSGTAGRSGSAVQGRQAPFAGRGRTPAPQSAPSGDGALAHKTSRDFRKEGKERDRNREERREIGRGRSDGRTQAPNKRVFNRVPKALQGKNNAPQEKKQEEAVTEIRIPERITVRDLADKMKIPGAQIVKELFMKGQMVTLNHELPYEKAEEIAMEHDIICEQEEKEDVIGALLAEAEEDESTMTSRPPVVCVMGHVDHGKTSLLDAIRNTHVTDREAGGITQHIGAYMVSVNGQKITFLDTPGHEAFTAMRMRGANATDIAVLVVAADDGVMPQTVEAINHARAAETEIIVAVNKIDKPGANIDRVKQELSEYDLVAEDWGGSTVFCPVSAKTQEGLDNLLEMILLTSEMHELKANAKRKARGIVLEARLDKGRGPVASILIQKGTLHQGDFIACGAAHGKVRAMTDENGKRLQKATPSMPVEIIGLSSVPEAGEVLVSMDSDKEAKAFAAIFVSENKKTLIEETKTQISLDDLFNQIKEGNLKELPIVVKADVQGSVEAVSQSLLKLSNEEVVVKVIHGGVGAINESDVSLAAASNAIIIGFNVKPDATAKSIAENQKVEVKLYNVIYEAIEDVERALKGMRAAVYEEKIQGHAEIRQIFKASQVGNIAGSYIKDGIFTRSSKVRVFRGDQLLYDGTLASLKRFKDDVKEVREGYECGLVFDGFGDFEEMDTVEAYTMVEVSRD